MKNIFIVFFTVCAFAAFSFAAPAEYRGKSSFEYKGGITGKPTVEEMRQAKDEAVKTAWNNFTAGLGTSRKSNYEKNKPALNINDFVLETYIIDERIDKKMKIYEVTVRIKIDETAFDNKLKSFSQAMKRDSDEKSYILAVFVGREAASETRFDDTKTSVGQYEASASAASGRASGVSYGEGASAAAEIRGSEVSVKEKTVSGGSSESRKVLRKYNVMPVTDFSNAFNKVLTESGYEAVQYEEVLECGVPDMEEIKAQFAVGDELAPELKSRLNRSVKECDISYIIVGYVDIGMPRNDPATGLKEVTSSVSGSVLDLRPRFAKVIGSVGSNSFRGRGADDGEAADKAVGKAAEAAARVIVDQLHSKGAY